MRIRKVILSMLFCGSMALSVTACGGEKEVESVANDSVGEISSARDEGTIESDAGSVSDEKVSFEAGDGESLEEIAGIWMLADNYIVIKEDGTWGYTDYYGNEELLGPVKFEDGNLFLALDDDDEHTVIECKPDGDGNFQYSGDEGECLIVSLNNAFPVQEFLPDGYAGNWQYEDKSGWLVLNEDTTWSKIDSEGNEIGSGRTYYDEEEEMLLVLEDKKLPNYYSYDEDDVLIGRDTVLNRVGDLENGSNIPQKLVGLWMYDDVAVCVYINSDGTWQAVNYLNEVFQQGEIIVGEDNESIILQAKDGSTSNWKIYDSDGLKSENGDWMDKLELSAAESIPENFLGMWQFDHLNLWITINEDCTWTAVNKENEVQQQGTVVIDKQSDETYVILNHNGMGYPIILSGNSTVYVSNPEINEYHAGVKQVEAIPAVYDYIGLYENKAEGYYVRFTEVETWFMYDKNGVLIKDDYFGIDQESGALAFRPVKERILLKSDGKGGWTDSAGITLTPAEFIPALDQNSDLPIENVVWYYEAKDLYFKFKYDEIASRLNGEAEAVCEVVDCENHLVAEGTVAFGMDAAYTVNVGDLSVVLTLNEEGVLVDGEGNVLVKEYYIPWYVTE